MQDLWVPYTLGRCLLHQSWCSTGNCTALRCLLGGQCPFEPSKMWADLFWAEGRGAVPWGAVQPLYKHIPQNTYTHSPLCEHTHRWVCVEMDAKQMAHREHMLHQELSSSSLKPGNPLGLSDLSPCPLSSGGDGHGKDMQARRGAQGDLLFTHPPILMAPRFSGHPRSHASLGSSPAFWPG